LCYGGKNIYYVTSVLLGPKKLIKLDIAKINGEIKTEYFKYYYFLAVIIFNRRRDERSLKTIKI